MTTPAANILHWLARPLGVGGPMLTKELTVTSRRRRYYLLRVLYLAAMTAFVAIVWSEVSRGTSAAYSVSRMAEAGKTVVGAIAWFQLGATQVLAVILLSTAISEELRRRTLPVLMTTPLSGLQIVLGKLFGKLLHLFVLLAISLPLLAIVRVFGGVPWNFVVASLAVTVCGAILTGAVCLHFSIRQRQSAGVVLCVLLVHMVLGAVGLHPAQAMGSAYLAMMSPAAVMTLWGAIPWWVHCGLMVLISLLFILRSARAVRRAGLAAGGGAPGRPSRLGRIRENLPRLAQARLPVRGRKKVPPQLGPTLVAPGIAAAVPPPPPPAAFVGARGRPAPAAKKIRRIWGPPLIWKELRFYLSSTRRRITAFAVLTFLIVLFSYVQFGAADMWDEPNFHTMCVTVCLVGGALITAILAPTCISAERESGTLPLLLTTPVSGWRILLAKALGVFYRAMPLWILLALHMLVFTAARYVHPLGVFQMALVTAGVVVFLTGVGLYLGLRFRVASTAAAMNVAVAAGLWIVLPFVAASMPLRAGAGTGLARLTVGANPAVQAWVVTQGATGGRRRAGDRELTYHWPGEYEAAGPLTTTGVVVISTMAYAAAGGLCAWAAKARLRRSLF